MTHYRNHDFTLRQLQYAVAVADCGGFGSAAEASGVSQPSLSVQIAKLEDVLGVKLFERGSRGALVTDGGQPLLDWMRQALAAAEGVEATARTLDDPLALPLRIGIIPTVAPYLLPAIVQELATGQFPVVHWLELQTARCELALESGELDAALIADPPARRGLVGMPVGWEPFEVVVPKEHVLQAPVEMRSLQHHPLMLLDEGHCLRDQTLTLCQIPESRQSAFRATSLSTLIQMVGSGVGVSVIPASAVEVEAGRANVRTLSFASETVGRTLQLVHRTTTPRLQMLETVAERMRAALDVVLGR